MDSGTGGRMYRMTVEEMQEVVGGRSFWQKVKAAARWVKNHIWVNGSGGGVKGKF